MNFWLKIKVCWYKFFGKEIHYELIPTKELFIHLETIDNVINKNIDLKHTLVDIPKIKEVNIWIVKPNLFKYIKDYTLGSKNYISVKRQTKEEYRAIIRETIKNAIKENTTIH